MKIRTTALLLFLAVVGPLIPLVAHALAVPPLRAHINDYGRMISAPAAQELEHELIALEKTDSTQIVVLTIPGLEGENLEDFSIKVAEAWKIGSKAVDNGVILLISREDRKVRIEVGRGLEGKLTDLVAGRIIRNSIVPAFKAGDFDGGVKAGVSGIIEVVRGEYKAEGREQGRVSRASRPIFTLFMLLIFLLVAIVIGGGLSKILGATVGTVGLPIVAKLAFPALSYPLLGGLGVLGLVMGLLLTAIFTGRGGGGGFWGGPFFGGGGSSGGDSGGDFSGGGGDFGGGGSSGDW
ncbi:MAG: TPM domain-containing protein [Syntrophorhabdales bacterium]|jgi:uncharacterized protein